MNAGLVMLGTMALIAVILALINRTPKGHEWL